MKRPSCISGTWVHLVLETHQNLQKTGLLQLLLVLQSSTSPSLSSNPAQNGSRLNWTNCNRIKHFPDCIVIIYMHRGNMVPSLMNLLQNIAKMGVFSMLVKSVWSLNEPRSKKAQKICCLWPSRFSSNISMKHILRSQK